MNSSAETAFQQLPRSAGLLLSITSLPSRLDLGDMGPAAFEFLRFLRRSHQTAWQLLPLNPVSGSEQYSPYSSSCSFAGNPLLISPEWLHEDGLITASQLNRHVAGGGGNLQTAEKARMATLAIAFDRFRERHPEKGSAFDLFCEENRYWLNDFADFTLLKEVNGNKPWPQWPAALKQRDPAAIQAARAGHSREWEFILWQQYIFDVQWTKLKTFAHSLGIRLIGDMPIYTAYDSSDVWANQSLFSLTADGRQIGTAGTPPDKFNPNGQRWGLPIYRWEVMEKDNYDWYLRRIGKALAQVDFLRLDHFRGFSAFWQIDADQSSAKAGEWIKGPGKKLFAALQQAFPSMPFIAEDLGHIDEDVYRLRDEFSLPGMEVLEFAFPKPEEPNVHISHNHRVNAVIYTGTHDTDTLVGWFSGLPDEEQRSLSIYFDMDINITNVALLLCRAAYRSVSKLCILPLQDVLALDGSTRMNDPAASEGNWSWRASVGSLTDEVAARLSAWCELFERSPV